MRVLQFPSQYQQGETPYEIFKDRMGAINSLVASIKGIIENKYNKGLIDTTIGQLEKARTEQQSTDMIDLLNAEPGEEIYPGGIEKIEETAGKFVDTFNTMGKLAQKESMMGNLPSMGGVSPTSGMPSGTPPTSEIMFPKGDKAQLLNAIQNMPDGQIDYQPILNYIKEHKPKFMGSSSPMEQWVMNQALGQESPKEALSKDLALAKQYSDYTESPITSEWDWLRKDPQGYAEAMKLKQSLTAPDKTAWEVQVEHLLQARKDELITDDELKKGMGIYIAPEKMSDFDKKFALAQRLNLSDNEWKKFFGVYLDEEETSKVKYYTTADECVANAPKIEGMTVDPTLGSKGWYPNYTKATEEDPNNYLFGKKDVYGNISRMGIIPYDAQMAVSYGTPLTEEQKTQIKNNHNVQKSLLNEEQLPKIEAILKQIGIDLEEKPEVILPTGEQSQAKSMLDKWVENAKSNIEGIKNIFTKETPTPKFTTEQKEAMIPTMTNEELYNVLKGLDPSDPMYKLLYEEAVKRGLIKK